MTLTAAIDPALVERCAEAAYQAAMKSVKNQHTVEPWNELPEYWRRLYRVQATAILETVGAT